MSIDNSHARRVRNRENAIALASKGVAVFPSSGKTPLVPLYNQLDSDITSQERAAAIAQWQERHGKYVLDSDGNPVIEKGTKTPKLNLPVHVGCTKTPDVVKRLWRHFKDAVPSIACGPSGLIVLDADKKDDGPTKLAALAEENGGWPERTLILSTQSGGNHIYFKQPGDMGNRAGALKRDYGTDVRGKGGQTVAPGSIREDGKTYGSREDLLKFLALFANNGFPELPEWVVAKIGAPGETESPLSDADPLVKNLMERLGATEWPDFDVVFDPARGGHDLTYLRKCEPDFVKLHEQPSPDRSTNRFRAARYLAGAFPPMRVEEYASFCNEWEGAGDLDNRQLAREWAKAILAPYCVYLPSDGSAFGDVSDLEENSGPIKPERFAFLDQIRRSKARLIDWAVKFFVARGTTSIVSGQWGAGKTAVFVDIALHVAHGIPYHGRKVNQGVAIYTALENPDDVERRVRTWCSVMENAGHNLDGGAFALHRGPCCLFDTSAKPTRDERELIKFAKRAADHYKLPVSMVVIDTLSQALQPGDEHKDGAKFVLALQRISQATGAHVVALHHPTKAGAEVRGDGAFQGNVDTIVTVSRDATGRGKIRAGSKFRIGDPSKVHFDYRLKAHFIGQDEDGDDISVVLAVAEKARPELAVFEDDESELVASDKPADKLAMVLTAVRLCVQEVAEHTGDKAEDIGVTAGQVFTRWNLERRSAGHEVLKDRTIVPRLLAKLVERGEVVKRGINRSTVYALAER